MSDQQALRKELESQLSNLQSRLQKIAGHIQKPKSADFEEQATDSENDEVLDALDVATRDRIVGLQAALARMDSGTYGKCEGCRRAITPARLEAIPWATLCVRCAE